MRAFKIIGGAVAGCVFCYWVGAYVMCTWIWPESNLCGLPAVFIAAPIGLVLGGVIATWLTARPAK